MSLSSSPATSAVLVSSQSLRSKILLRTRAQFSASNLVQLTSELSHNQVLTSAIFGSATAQFLKPFSSLLSGKGFNWRLVLKSGGMPSSHAAGVVAAAIAVGLERGLSDPLFGMSVVVAGIVMYDAQGVRRAVGKQAEVINTMVFTYTKRNNGNKEGFFQRTSTAQSPEEKVEEVMEGPYERSSRFFKRAEMLPSIKGGEVFIQEIGDEDGWRHIPLKESVGHTKLQVIVGAVLGAVITIVLHT